MIVDVTAATAFGNGAAAIALIVALLDALQSSGKLTIPEVDQIIGRASALLAAEATQIGLGDGSTAPSAKEALPAGRIHVRRVAFPP